MTTTRPRRRSPHITAEGADALRKELDHLWRVRRPEVTRAVAEAAAMGDRSENAEYIYGKKQLREIDRRVRYLSKRLDEVLVVRELPADRSRIRFGAWFEVDDADGQRQRLRIVGSDEIDRAPGYISVDSPMARAAMGKAVDDTLLVATPRGDVELTVTGIWYPDQ